MKTKTISKASDREVQTAARSAGVDEIGSHYLDVIEKEESLSKQERQLLVRALKRFGYRSVRIKDGCVWPSK